MGDKQITVNCIAPGGIRTDMYHKVCREYIPNGANLNDAEVDEVRELMLEKLQSLIVLIVCCNLESSAPCWSTN